MSKEAMLYYPFGIRRDREAVVFWDAEDYPIRSGVDHESVFEKIKETLRGWGCAKVSSIHAYVTYKLSDELRRKYEEAQIIIHECDVSANWQMLVDIYMLSIRCDDPSNLIVLSKHFTEDTMFWALEGLYGDGFGVFLSDSGREYDPECDEIPSDESTAMVLTRLFGKRTKRLFRKRMMRKRKSLLSMETGGDLTLKSQAKSCNSLVEFMSRDLPIIKPNSEYYNVRTWVLVVMDNGGDVRVLKKKLEIALTQKGYFGQKRFCGHVLCDEKDVKNQYFGTEFSLTFNKGEGFDKLLADILWMASLYSSTTRSNMVILSNDKKFGQGTRLAEVCQILKEKLFNVAIAQTDQLIKLAEEKIQTASSVVTQIPYF